MRLRLPSHHTSKPLATTAPCQQLHNNMTTTVEASESLGKKRVQTDELCISLSAGNPKTGLRFAGGAVPLQVAEINPKENPALNQYEFENAIVGKYVVALRLPDLGVTVSYFRSPSLLDPILAQTYLHNRELVLSPTPPVLDPRISGLMYMYEIPCHEPVHKHFKLEGFPPRIQSMSPQSPLNVVLSPGLFVVSFLCPSHFPDFQMESGGFTAYALEQRMEQTSHIPGRWINFTQANPTPSKRQPKTPLLFDWGGLFSSKRSGRR